MLAGGSGLVVLLCSIHRWIVDADPQRLKLAACIWFGLAMLALVWTKVSAFADRTSFCGSRPTTALPAVTAFFTISMSTAATNKEATTV